MAKSTKTKYRNTLKAISEIAYIQFRLAGVGADKQPYISTFVVRKANDPIFIHLINSWLSIVYF